MRTFFNRFKMKNFAFILLIVAVFVMSMAYAAFRAELGVEGVATVDDVFKINITSVSSTISPGVTAGDYDTYNYQGNTFYATSTSPTTTGQTHTLTFANTGNLKAKLVAIYVLAEGDEQVSYSITSGSATAVTGTSTANYTSNGGIGTSVDVDGTVTFTIKTYCNTTSCTNKAKNIMVSFSWVQDTTQSSVGTNGYRVDAILAQSGRGTTKVTDSTNGLTLINLTKTEASGKEAFGYGIYGAEMTVTNAAETSSKISSVTARNDSGTTITLTCNSTLTSCTFTMPASDVIITTTYTLNEYTLTVNPNGGTWNDTTSISLFRQKYGTTLSVSPVTKRASVTLTYDENETGADISATSATVQRGFSKWVLTGSGSLAGVASPAVTAETYTFGAGDGTLTAEYLSTIGITLPTITKTGYTCYWYENADLTGTYYTPGVYARLNAVDTTLYAGCEANTYTISSNDLGTGGGTTSVPSSATYGSTVTITATPNSSSTVTSVSVNTSSDVATAITTTCNSAKTSCTFVMTDSNVSVAVTYTAVPAPTCSISLSGTEGDNDWYISDVSATLTRSGQDITSTTYTIGTTVLTNPSSLTQTVSDEGITSVSAEVCNAGGCGTCASDVMIDKTAPTVTFGGISSSYQKSQTVSIGYDDEGGSGLASTNSYLYQYGQSVSSPNASGWLTYTGPITFNGTGFYYVLFKQIADGAGNVSETSYSNSASGNWHASSVIRVDITAPNISSFTYSSGTLSATARDYDSGLVSYRFWNPSASSGSSWISIDKTTSSVTQTYSTTKSGTWYVYFKDYVGNMSYEKITVGTTSSDTTDPTCSLQFSEDSYFDNDWYKTNGTITFASKSDDVAVTKYYISTDSDASSGSTSVSITTEQPITTYYGIVEDAAGNRGTCEIDVGLDKTAPSVSIPVYKLCNSSYYSDKTCSSSYTYTSAKATYEGHFVIVDTRSQVRLFGTTHLSNRGTDEDAAIAYATKSATAYPNVCETNSSGNLECERSASKGNASYWNCYTHYGTAGYPKLDGSYKFTVAAFDNAGNYMVVNSSAITYVLSPSGSCSV